MKIKKEGDGWRVDFSVRQPDGSRFRIRRKVYGSRRDVQAWVNDVRNAAKQNRIISPEPETQQPQQFEAFAWTWFESYVRANNKPSEVTSKETMLRRHLVPFFGNSLLRDLTAQNVERYKADKLLSLSPKSINNHLICLQKLMNSAVEWGILEHNQLKRVRKLKVQDYEWTWLNREETEQLLAACSDRWRPFFAMAVWTGLRLGELLAVRWSDISWSRSTVTVRRSFYRGTYVSPKGNRPRTVPLNSRLVEMLRAMRHSRSELVFCTSEGTSLDPSNVKRPFYSALARAELPRIRLHDLRHSFASQLVAGGVSLRVVQELLGHQSLTMTLRYAHLAPCATRDAVEVLVAS